MHGLEGRRPFGRTRCGRTGNRWKVVPCIQGSAVVAVVRMLESGVDPRRSAPSPRSQYAHRRGIRGAAALAAGRLAGSWLDASAALGRLGHDAGRVFLRLPVLACVGAAQDGRAMSGHRHTRPAAGFAPLLVTLVGASLLAGLHAVAYLLITRYWALADRWRQIPYGAYLGVAALSVVFIPLNSVWYSWCFPGVLRDPDLLPGVRRTAFHHPGRAGRRAQGAAMAGRHAVADGAGQRRPRHRAGPGQLGQHDVLSAGQVAVCGSTGIAQQRRRRAAAA